MNRYFPDESVKTIIGRYSLEFPIYLLNRRSCTPHFHEYNTIGVRLKGSWPSKRPINRKTRPFAENPTFCHFLDAPQPVIFPQSSAFSVRGFKFIFGPLGEIFWLRSLGHAVVSAFYSSFWTQIPCSLHVFYLIIFLTAKGYGVYCYSVECGRSLMVKPRPSKPIMRVRFPSPACLLYNPAEDT